MKNAIEKNTDRTRTIKELENLSPEERATYFQSLKNHCANNIKKKSFNSFTRRIVFLLGLIMRKYELEVRGAENIPKSEETIFVCNHSNSHDFFTLTEVFTKLHIRVTPLAASDGLNCISKLLFHMGNITFLRRGDKESQKEGEYILCNRLLNGISVIIYAESTWNLHPINAMLPIKAGPVGIALITEKKIVPTIFEYIEVEHECRKESELYRKCVVCFGEPIAVSMEEGIFKQADNIQKKMEEMRRSLWEEFGIKRKELSDIDKNVYLNHLHLKKNKAIGFRYVSEHESLFIRRVNGKYENEYYVNEEGEFVPRIYL